MAIITKVTESINVDFFVTLNNVDVIIGILALIIIFIIYSMLYIAVFLGLLESIKQAKNEEKIKVMNNIKKGFFNFYKSMKIYWYIFSYTFLIPAVLFII
jgi:hypothetical protein